MRVLVCELSGHQHSGTVAHGSDKGFARAQNLCCLSEHHVVSGRHEMGTESARKPLTKEMVAV